MNGASAEPSARISKPPSTSMTTMMGSNQTFLRALRNLQNSVKKAIADVLSRFSELVGQAGRIWPGRGALDPVAWRMALVPTFKDIPAPEPHCPSGGSQDPVEHGAEHDWANDSIQDGGEP